MFRNFRLMAAKFQRSSPNAFRTDENWRRIHKKLPWLNRFQVSSELTIACQLELIEFSCANSELKIRDPSKQNEIIAIYREDEIELNNGRNNLTSSGNTLALEYLAPRRDCRVNVRFHAWQDRRRDGAIVDHLRVSSEGILGSFYHRNPALFVGIASVVLVAIVSGLGLLLQFHFQKVSAV